MNVNANMQYVNIARQPSEVYELVNYCIKISKPCVWHAIVFLLSYAYKALISLRFNTHYMSTSIQYQYLSDKYQTKHKW